MPALRFKRWAGIGLIPLRWPGPGVYMYTQLAGLSSVRYTIHQTGGGPMSAQCYKGWTGI